MQSENELTSSINCRMSDFLQSYLTVNTIYQQ